MFKHTLNFGVIWTVFVIALHSISFNSGVVWPILLVGVGFGLYAIWVHIDDLYPQVADHIFYPWSDSSSGMKLDVYINPALVSSVLLTESFLLLLFA